jgi:UDP-N-acetylmuramoylalanine--D-glutamate ligase
VKPRPAIPAGPYLIVGLARSGVAVARVLRAREERVIGLDARTPAAAAALAELGVPVHSDRDGLALLADVQTVVKSPGVPADSPVVVAARERGLAVLGELELAWRLLGNEFIAVTGTNGKTTTVELIGHIYREAGLPVAVAGNVGTALSSLVDVLEADATIVCEASSFQLEDTLAFAPEAAVLLNVTPDHLDRHGTLEAYAAAKLEVFARQRDDDVAVLPAGFEARFMPGGAGRRFAFGWDATADLFELDGELWWQGDPLISLAELSLRGRHNVENAMAAATVCLARGLAPRAVRAALASFRGVAHRLEEIAELDGVLYVNDSKATNVASTLVALDAFAGRPLHLILGGQGKGQDFTSLREPVARSCAAVYVIGESTPTIATALKNVAPPVLECGELERAVLAARAAIAGDPQAASTGLLAADSGPVVLLSPACASFDQFADFEARGGRFRELVEKLQG